MAALSVAGARSPAPLGRLAGASVVVAGDTQLRVTLGRGEDAQAEAVPLPAYRGVPARLAQGLAHVPGVAKAAGETGFPGGTSRPGTVDLVAVTASPGVTPAALARRVRDALHGGAGYTIATGAARGGLADPGLATERADGQALGAAVIPILVLTALFVLAATTALSVDLRRRRFALLRAVGATRGQVRRAVLAEQSLLGLAGGLLGWLPGAALGALAVRALAAHGLLPAGSSAWSTPWLAALACAVTLPVCVLSGLVAARRAARTRPARAVREAGTQRGWPHPVRLLLGLAAAAGVVVLNVVSLRQNGPAAQLALAGPLLMCGMAAVALLGPVLVAVAAAAARPLRAAGPSARLALAGMRVLPRRTASAVVPVALAVGMIGAVAFSNTSIAHATGAQAARAVTASDVLAGTGLDNTLLNSVRALRGVRAAAGISTMNIAVTDPDLEFTGGAAVSGGRLDGLLDLGVVAGNLAGLRPGQLAVSALEASGGALGTHLGSRVTVWLPDGTPYTATVSAIYARSLAIGDLLIPASVAAGHTGTPDGYSQILVDGASQARLAALAAARPGVRVATRQVYNAQLAQNSAQDSFADNLILGVIAVLAAVTMINTLAVATVERRRQVRLLSRAGATRTQLAGMFGWQALFVTVLGIAAGAAVCAGTLTAIDRAVTGSPAPYIPLVPAALLAATVAALATGTIMASAHAMSGRAHAFS